MLLQISKIYFKNFLSFNEIRLLKNSLEGGLVNKLNIIYAYLLINIFLLLPFIYLIKLKTLQNNNFKNEVDGFIIFRKNILKPNNHFNIDFLVIEKGSRKKGFGTNLINIMINQIKLENTLRKRIYISAQTLKFDNVQGNNFYRKNDFKLVKSYKKYNFYLRILEY